MRIKYDFEEEYKQVDLGAFIKRLLEHPKQFLEMELQPLIEEIKAKEDENKDAHFLLNTITSDEVGLEVNNYGEPLSTKIDNLLPFEIKVILLEKLEEIRNHWK